MLKQIGDEKRASLKMSRIKKQLNKHQKSGLHIIQQTLRSDFENIVPKKNKIQVMKFNQLGLEVHDTYKRDERITTNFEPDNNENIINKACFDEKTLRKKWSCISLRK